MARKPSIAALRRKMEVYAKQLAKTRDGLRELEDDVEAYRESATDAVENLEYAIERLSELV